MSLSPGISLEILRGGTLARIGIRIPPVNVLNIAALCELVRRVGEARGARVLILSGLPRAFSAGVEVAEHAPETGAVETMLAAMRGVLTALLETPAVTIAAISGACLGGGAEIAAVCDLVIAVEDARIGFPEIRLACFPPGAAAFLALRIGEARAAEWILTGASVSGREATSAGFASRVVPLASLESEAARLADSLLARSAPALSAAVDLLRQRRREALAKSLPRAEEAYRRLVGSPDLARAVEEFRNKCLSEF